MLRIVIFSILVETLSNMSIHLSELSNYIAVPDYPPHCLICGFRAIIIGDFFHTNYKGGIYICGNCENGTNLFIEQEDIDFSLDYWEMSQKNRRIYTNLTEEEKTEFSKFTEGDKKNFFKMKKTKRALYLDQLVNNVYLFFDLPITYIETLKSI